MANPPTIESVEAFEAHLPGLSFEQALEKIPGRRSLRKEQAARRLANKTRKVKIPRNLLRRLWRMTGGWAPNSIQPGWNWPGGDPTQITDFFAVKIE